MNHFPFFLLVKDRLKSLSRGLVWELRGRGSEVGELLNRGKRARGS